MNKNYLIIIGIIVIALVAIAGSSSQSNKPEVSTNSTVETVSTNAEANTAVFPQDFIHALENYHLGSMGTDIDETSDDIAFDLMVKLKNDNNKLQAGNRYLEKYKGNDNEVIKIATEGTLLGSRQVIDANNRLYEFLKYEDPTNPNVAGTRDAIARYISEQKEGYSTIALFAPQIGYLIFSPAETENPSGKIPYLISDTDRKSLLDQIDRSFGEYLYKTETNGDKNSIIFVVETLRSYLEPDTYEEASLN